MNADRRATFPYGTDEFAAAGLTKVACDKVAPPRIAEAPVAMECRLDRIVEVGRAGTAVIIGEILLWHVHDELIVERAHRPRPAGRDRPHGRAQLRAHARPLRHAAARR